MPDLRPRVSPSDRLIKTSSSISVSQSWGGERQDKTLSIVGTVQFLSFYTRTLTHSTSTAIVMA